MSNVSRTLRITAILTACAAIPATARPQAMSDAARNNAEERLGQAALKVVEAGIPLYNTQRDYAGCYWLYRGALLSYVPLLSGYPAQAEVLKALKDADARPDAASKAMALRAGMDAVARLRKAVSPTSLWARLGGEPAVSAVVHDFVARAAGDPKVDFTRGDRFPIDARGVATLERLLVEQISSASGGPYKYTGRDMAETHAGMGITGAQFGSIADDLVAVLKQYKVGAREIDELVGAIAGMQGAIVEKP